MNLKNFITISLILFLIAPIAAADSVTITTSLPGDQVFDNELVTLYAQLSNTSMLHPYLRFSFTPTEPQAPFMDEWATGIYKQNINISVFPAGIMQILVVSGEYSDSLNVTINHDTAIEPEPTPEPLKNLSVEGLKTGGIYNNESLIITVTDADTLKPVPFPAWSIISSTGVVDEGTGYNDGMAWIDWNDNFDNTLAEGLYRIEISATGYGEKGFLITFKLPEPILPDEPKLKIDGFDEYVTTLATSKYTITDNEGEPVNDVLVKVYNENDVVINSKSSDYNGRVIFDWSGFPAGDLVVEFTKEGYKKIVQDITIYSNIPFTAATTAPTPTPAPTPLPPPTEFIWSGFTFPIPHTVTLKDGTTRSYRSASEFSEDFQRVDGVTVERVKATTTPTPAPTAQEINSSIIPAVQEPKLEIGWLLTGLGIIGLIGMVVFKNHSKSHPESATMKGLRETAKDVIAAIKKPETTLEHIPVQNCEPDFDIEASITGSTSDVMDIPEQEGPHPDTKEGPEESEPPTPKADEIIKYSLHSQSFIDKNTPEPEGEDLE